MAKLVLLVLIVLLFMGTISWSIKDSNSYCLENERQALVDFKQGLVDASYRLSSWVGQDCCKWKGVGCNNRTGHVVKLDLRNPFPFNEDRVDPLNPNGFTYEATVYERACLQVREVNPSILELKHLNYLDLSWNNFSGIKIPNFFGSFQELTYMNLSSAWFGGPVPHHLGNLSALRSLDLSIQYLLSGNFENTPQMIVDTFHWTSNLFYLKQLDMSGLDLTNTLADSFLVIASLRSLRELRLSNCGLGTIPLFHFHANLTSLVILDLSSNSFQDPIPNAIRNLTSLEVLDLSDNKFSSNGSILDELKDLTCLKILWLSHNKFGRKAIERLGNFSSPSIADNLHSFYLSYNMLDGYLPTWLYHLKNLKNLHLSSNSFRGPIPTSFGAFPSLMKLDLSNNELNGSIPTSLGKLSALEVLHLGGNEITGRIPSSLGKLSALRVLDLGSNQLSGRVPSSFGRLSKLSLLDLSHNQLSGQIPMSFGRLSNLTVLNLGKNELSGHIPMLFGSLITNLTELDLSSNLLNGTVPESLGQLPNLIEINLSKNSLNGVLTEVHFAKLSKLESLVLTMNSLSLNIRSGWLPPFRLYSIELGSCVIGPQFPEWLRTQIGFNSLNMSNAGISDSIPSWFENISSQISIIDLSGNKIYGKVPNLTKSRILPMQIFLSSNRLEGALPDLPLNLAILDLSNNTISGPIPKNIGDMVPELNFLGLSNNHINGSIPASLCKMQSLYYLDLSKNQLSGDLPHCWSSLQILQVIDLTSNNLSGTIPSSICQLPLLASLHLSNNTFSGDLSPALRYCESLSILDLAENSLSGSIPTRIGENLPSLTILRLRSNKFNGKIPRKLCLLNNLQILDIAHNNLSGTIPHCFGNLSSMVFRQRNGSNPDFITSSYYTDKISQVIKGRELEYFKILPLVVNLDISSNNITGEIPKSLTRLSGLIGLNLSDNHLIGHIPEDIGKMRSLQSLDFSLNHLSGAIPLSISTIYSLSHLNLSYNNLSGPIPIGNQLQTIADPSIYKGNHELCGPPVEKKCSGDEPPRTGEDEGDEFRINLFYVGLASGFVVSFGGVCVVLLFKKSWRYAYFKFVDEIRDKIYVVAVTRIVRLKKKFKCNRNEE